MDYETVNAAEFGASLRGIGLNILVRNVPATTAFLKSVFNIAIHQPTNDFAIATYGKEVFQIHSDGTYSKHPLLNMLPENPPRGAGLEIHLYETDPDEAVTRAIAAGATILAEPLDKPHGLREAYILDADGYCWVPSRPL